LPEPPHRLVDWRIVVDANAKDEVGDVFLAAGADVVWVTREFDEGFPDDGIDDFARTQGRIIVGHDQRFLQSIQQRMFQFNIPATSGYGRIMLCGREDRQPDRLREALPFLILCLDWARATNHRFLITVADNWIRFDDKPIARIV
jgi:Domain of unknown function (DUF5615)